jgi:predicted ATPase
MPHIEGIRIQNYRLLKDITLGKTSKNWNAEPLPQLITIIGPNGCGKSTLIDALAFLGDCLAEGVKAACDKPHRGGIERLLTRGQDNLIQFEIYYRHNDSSTCRGYYLCIGKDKTEQPYIIHEYLGETIKYIETNAFFLSLKKGQGDVKIGADRIEVSLTDHQLLGISTFGNLANYPHIVAFREFLESWYLADFIPNLGHHLTMMGAQKHLARDGNNLANYAQYLSHYYPSRFEKVLRDITQCIPSIDKIIIKITEDNRLLLQFTDHHYTTPFYAQEVSAGILKFFAYSLLLQDPEPAALIGIEELENGLHHHLVESLALEMKQVTQNSYGPQILLTTHAPHFIDILMPEEVWIMKKNAQGFSTIERAIDIQMLRELSTKRKHFWYTYYVKRGQL